MYYIPNMTKFDEALAESMTLFEVAILKKYKPYYVDANKASEAVELIRGIDLYPRRVSKRMQKYVFDSISPLANAICYLACDNVSADHEGHPAVKAKWLTNYRNRVGKTINMFSWYCVFSSAPIEIDNVVMRVVANLRICKAAYELVNKED